MKRVEKSRTFVIRRSTLMILAALYLVAGFLVGIIYKGVESEKYIDMRELLAEQSVVKDQHARSQQQFNRISALLWKLADNPGNVDVWTELGLLYRGSGNPGEAVRAFDRAIQLDDAARTPTGQPVKKLLEKLRSGTK